MITKLFRVPLTGTLIRRVPPKGKPDDPVETPQNVKHLFGRSGRIVSYDFDMGDCVMRVEGESPDDLQRMAQLEVLLKGQGAYDWRQAIPGDARARALGAQPPMRESEG